MRHELRRVKSHVSQGARSETRDAGRPAVISSCLMISSLLRGFFLAPGSAVEAAQRLEGAVHCLALNLHWEGL